MSIVLTTEQTTPWHLWAVAIVSLLWNAAGAFTIMMAQAGRLYDLEPGETAYYAAQRTWFVVVTDTALLSAIVAALALLARKRAAVWLFALSIVAIVISNGYDLAAGTSRMFENTAALVVSVMIWLIAVGEFLYASAMQRRGVLR